MDVVHNILDWLSKNSRNLNEIQKKEVYDLLNSIRGELGTQMGSTSRDHQPPRFPPTTDHGGKNYHGFAGRGGKHASFQSKIDQVTSIVNKETGYINGKIDTITKEYKEQLKTLKDKVRELENQKNQREREEKKVSNQDIDHLAQSLKDLMNGIAKESQSHSFPFPSNSTPLPPQGPPPPYQPYPSTVPNPNVAYFPPPPPHHIPPQFHAPPRPYEFSMGASFPPNHLNPAPSDMNQNVYRFSGNRGGSGPNSYHNRGAGHSKPRFDHKPLHHGNDGKFHGNFKKNYCDSHWKKFDHKNKDQGSKNEPTNAANEKSHHRVAPQDKPSGDSNRGKPHHANQFKTHADRGRNKRDQQFGKNRSQNQGDGAESDSSVASHVSSKNTRKEFTPKTGPTRDIKAAPNKPPQASTGKTDNSKSKKPEDKEHKNNPTSGPSSKNTHKESKIKTQHSCDFAAAQNKKSPKSASKTDGSDLQKLQYPSKAEALKRGIDIYKSLDSPSMCLGKKGGHPFSRAARSLADIYNFEAEFGSCQVIRF